jgi:hypothetical protein
MEGGHRLIRRDYNIYTAFSYGKKLRYSELDDPLYKQKLLYDMKCKRIKSEFQKPKKGLIGIGEKDKLRKKAARTQTLILRQ